MKNLIICLLFFGFMISIQKPVFAQNSQQLFQKGLIQEEGEGDLTKAIDIYNSIANDVNVNRELRAKSLLHVGICYEKLGNQNARKTYQRLISEYSDQKDIVALGKEKLNGLKKLNPIEKKQGIVASQVWSESQDFGGISANGRYINYIDWDNISTNIIDLQTGKTKALTNTGTWEGSYKYPDRSVISPDSKKLAYYWYINAESYLHIINIDGSFDRIIATGNKEIGAPWPVAWSPDGNYILAIIGTYIDFAITKSRKIVLVSVNDGSVKDLKSFDNQIGGRMDISPDNKYVVYSKQQNENSQENDIYILSMDGSIDKKLVGDLANDINPLWSPDGKGIIFRSNRYGSDDLWKLRVENGNAIGKAKLVNANLGNSNTLLNVTKDKSVYYITGNSRRDIYTVGLNLNVSKGNQQGERISNLSENRNTSPFWSSDGRYVTYLRWPKYNDILGYQYRLTIYDTKTKTSRNIDTEIYGYPRLNQGQWSSDGKKIVLNGLFKKTMKAGLFLFDIDTGKYTELKVSSNLDNLMRNNLLPILSHNGKSIYYLSADRNKISKIDINSKKETLVFSDTEAIWQFTLSNDDSKIAFRYWFENTKEFYIVSTSGGEKKKILSSTSDNSIYLNTWGQDDKYLYFTEGDYQNFKKLMRVSIEGGGVEEVLVFKDVFENGKIRKVDMHPDGQHLAVTLMVGLGNEIWKLEGIFDE